MHAAREAFAERGYHGATLADIGGRVGVSPAALLRHAAGKKELFEAAMAPAAAADPFPLDFLREADPAGDPAPVLRRLAHTAIPFLEKVMGENIARRQGFKDFIINRGCDIVQLDVRNVRTMTLIVETGSFGDVQANLNWAKARLIKKESEPKK